MKDSNATVLLIHLELTTVVIFCHNCKTFLRQLTAVNYPNVAHSRERVVRVSSTME